MEQQQRAPAFTNSLTIQQLWEALGSKLEEASQGRLLYTQGAEVQVLYRPL